MSLQDELKLFQQVNQLIQLRYNRDISLNSRPVPFYRMMLEPYGLDSRFFRSAHIYTPVIADKDSFTEDCTTVPDTIGMAHYEVWVVCRILQQQ